MPPTYNHEEIKTLLQENHRLLTENNELLKKLHKAHIQGVWFKVISFFFIVVAPLIILYYYILPMLGTIYGGANGSSLNIQDISTLLQGL